MRIPGWLVASFASLSLAGCGGGGLVPPSTVGEVPVAIPASRPMPASRPIPATPMAPTPVATTSGDNAFKRGLLAGPDFSAFPVTDYGASRALQAFRLTCPSLMKRNDASGLTRGPDWAAACAAARATPDNQAKTFFATHFEVVQVGDGKAHATGYYEPEIMGARTPGAAYQVPVYRRPPELQEIDLGAFSDTLKGKKLRGKVEGGAFVPFADRGQIEEGALAGRGLEIAWAADPVEFFFLQVQGSGRLRLPDGSVMRIGYDSQNGRDYTGIGKLMKDRGLLGPGQSSMQGIMDWLRTHPEEGKQIMRENRSWVFFREITGPGPLGAMNQPVTPRGTVAADPAFVPLGAPVLLSLDRAEPNGLWVAQDTGGAIKGSNRFDTYWGHGDEARALAGGMSAKGSAYLLVPLGTLSRLVAEAASASPTP